MWMCGSGCVVCGCVVVDVWYVDVCDCVDVCAV